MRSMTGFGQSAGESSRYRVSVVIRGVNHRQLDLVVRLRDEYRSSHGELRELLVSRLHRGRVEVTVEVEAMTAREFQVRLRREVVEAIHGALAELAESGLDLGRPGAGDLLQVPQVLEISPLPNEWTDEDHHLLLRVAEEALQQFLMARSHEGEQLKGFLLSRAEQEKVLVEQLSSRRLEVQATMRGSLAARLAEILSGEPLDEGRLEQEVAILVERSDVSEELDRLAAHLDHFIEVTQRMGPVGRRLDFLTQEILREWTTLGAKCRDIEMSRWALDGKVLCEQLREQVQNVE